MPDELGPEFLRRRLEAYLGDAAEQSAPTSGPSSSPSALDESRLMSTLNQIVAAQKILSNRIERLAVEVLKRNIVHDREVKHLKTSLESMNDQLIASGKTVEYVELEDMLIGLPAEEQRLCAYCRYRGAPEAGTLKAFRSVIQEGMVVVDVGANVGIFTIAAARRVGHRGKVIAYEPTPRTYDLLQENIQINGLLETGIVETKQYAVSDECRTSTFYVAGAGSGHNSLYAVPENRSQLKVETRSLDSEITGPVDVVKIDAEGAESRILNGMTETIARSPSLLIIMEFAPSLLTRAGTAPEDLLNHLSDQGLAWRVISEPDGDLLELTPDALLSRASENLLVARADSLTLPWR